MNVLLEDSVSPLIVHFLLLVFRKRVLTCKYSFLFVLKMCEFLAISGGALCNCVCCLIKQANVIMYELC